ncbi:MAG: GTP 3',8-cyclase MoaA [Deltaproteobacteria bacterium]|nr:GTP 3',8-cyclase MoaA [Deltaproteobacteria bacterium]
MNDGHNRRINYLRISVTDRCNLRCVYCMPKEGVSLAGHSDILRYEEILRLVKVAVKLGITKIRITGGEPLVRRGIADFVAAVSAIDGVEEISLTTNGILLPRLAQPLFDAGIRRINISMDSLKAARYAQITGGGDLATLWEGIRAAQEAGFTPLKLNTVAIKNFNDDEVLDFAQLAWENDLQVRFIEFMPLGGTKLGEFISNDDLQATIMTRYRLQELPPLDNDSRGPAQLFAIEGGKGKIGFISPLSHTFCAHCNRLRLTSFGSLRACLLNDAEVNIREALRGGCSAEELEAIIREVIAQKPREHCLTTSSAGNFWRKCQREMFQIGG